VQLIHVLSVLFLYIHHRTSEKSLATGASINILGAHNSVVDMTLYMREVGDKLKKIIKVDERSDPDVEPPPGNCEMKTATSGASSFGSPLRRFTRLSMDESK
jgi:hypothetical protein